MEDPQYLVFGLSGRKVVRRFSDSSISMALIAKSDCLVCRVFSHLASVHWSWRSSPHNAAVSMPYLICTEQTVGAVPTRVLHLICSFSSDLLLWKLLRGSSQMQTNQLSILPFQWLPIALNKIYILSVKSLGGATWFGPCLSPPILLSPLHYPQWSACIPAWKFFDSPLSPGILSLEIFPAHSLTHVCICINTAFPTITDWPAYLCIHDTYNLINPLSLALSLHNLLHRALTLKLDFPLFHLITAYQNTRMETHGGKGLSVSLPLCHPWYHQAPPRQWYFATHRTVLQ